MAFTDPDVDKGVVALVGIDMGRDEETGELIADVRPALGEPAEVAKTLVHEAKNGHDVVRLVSGDPLTTDSVIAEVTAVARTQFSSRFSRVCLPVRLCRATPAWRSARVTPRPTFAVKSTGLLWPLHRDACPARDVRTSRRDRQRAGRERLGPADACCDHRPRYHSSAANRRGNSRDAQRSRIRTGGLAHRHRRQGCRAAQQDVVVESRALYGWTVLVPRTKDQAGEMSDRLVTHGAIPIEVPTIAVEPPRSPAQMERSVKGLVDGRYQWVVSLPPMLFAQYGRSSKSSASTLAPSPV